MTVFHITNRFINNLPFGNDFFTKIKSGKLEELGIRLWDNLQDEAIISKNAGVVSHSYCPFSAASVLDEIDLILFDYLNVPKETLFYLKNYIVEMMVAGRKNEKNLNAKLKYLKLNN